MTSSKPLLPSRLPFELVEEILQRAPIESLVRYKSICKQWDALFNDMRFIYKHFDLSQQRFMLVDHKSFQLANLETKAFLCRQTPGELHNYNILKTLHCDGLLLCKCSEIGIHGDTTIKLAVLNPVLNRIKWIELPSPSKIYDAFAFGYGNVSRDDYKILRIGDTRYDIIKGRSSSYIEIYEFKSKLWRSVNATLECTPPWRYVSMNGNMYWIARNKMAGTKSETFIQCFDFSTETFKPIICYVPNGIDCYGKGLLSCFGGDRLSLLHREEHVKKMEVWVSSKLTDDGIVSWSKYFNATPDPLTECTIVLETSIVKTNKFMLWCWNRYMKSRVVHVDVYEMGDEGEIKKHVEVTGRRRLGDYESYVVYVPSLVPVPE